MEWIARMLDAPFGWVLEAPRDVAIALLAVATSLLLTLVRKWTTNQDRLRRAASDLLTLKARRREARRAKDRDAVRRLGAIAGMVRGVRLRAEGLPLLVSIVPIALLAVWAVQRLDYEPLRVGEEAVIRAYYPLGSADWLTHLVAPEGVTLPERAVRQVVVDGEAGTNGVASWTFLPTEAVGDVTFVIRHRGEALRHAVRVDGRTYVEPVVVHGDGSMLATEVVLERAKFLGIVPGVEALAFPPWLVAYLLLTMAMVPALRRLLRVG